MDKEKRFKELIEKEDKEGLTIKEYSELKNLRDDLMSK